MFGLAHTLMRWPGTTRGWLFGLHAQPSLLLMTGETLWGLGMHAGTSPPSCGWWMCTCLPMFLSGSSVICAPGVFPHHGDRLYAPPAAPLVLPLDHQGHLHLGHVLSGPATRLSSTLLLLPSHPRVVGFGRQSPTTVFPRDLSGPRRLFGDPRTIIDDWTYLQVQ